MSNQQQGVAPGQPVSAADIGDDTPVEGHPVEEQRGWLAQQEEAWRAALAAASGAVDGEDGSAAAAAEPPVADGDEQSAAHSPVAEEESSVLTPFRPPATADADRLAKADAPTLAEFLWVRLPEGSGSARWPDLSEASVRAREWHRRWVYLAANFVYIFESPEDAHNNERPILASLCFEDLQVCCMLASHSHSARHATPTAPRPDTSGRPRPSPRVCAVSVLRARLEQRRHLDRHPALTTALRLQPSAAHTGRRRHLAPCKPAPPLAAPRRGPHPLRRGR